MLSSCKTCIISLVRERALLWGTLLFPLVLCLLFIAVFSGLNGAYADVTTRLGIVEDDHYAAAPGLSKTMDAISEENADPRIATITGFEDEDAAIEAANSNAIDAYLRVDADGTPELHVASRMNGELQPAVLEAVLDSYLHARGVQARLAAREPEAAAEGGARVALRTDAVKTRQLKVTESSPDPSVRYYFALLGMAAGMGMVFACHAVKSTQAGSTPVGGRVSLAGIARWKVLLGCSWARGSVSLCHCFSWRHLCAGSAALTLALVGPSSWSRLPSALLPPAPSARSSGRSVAWAEAPSSRHSLPCSRSSRVCTVRRASASRMRSRQAFRLPAT